MTKLYWIVGLGIVLGFAYVTSQGVVFSGTDGGPPTVITADGRTRGRAPIGGFFFFGRGYRGGK